MLTLIALAIATATPAVQEAQEMAYIAGRCTVWMDDATKRDVERSLTAADPRLMILYRDGINDTNEGIRYDVCRRLFREGAARLSAR